jgi:hypothetical protein|tara:strand:+ start:244 stop:468 length:225 start_codon:yes stop_codon:yes gene_type:complete
MQERHSQTHPTVAAIQSFAVAAGGSAGGAAAGGSVVGGGGVVVDAIVHVLFVDKQLLLQHVKIVKNHSLHLHQC